MSTEQPGPHTFPQHLMLHAQARPEHPALREKSRGIWQTLSWRQLADEVAALAAGLQAQGVQRGDHVGLLSENRPRLFAAMAAAQWLGAVVVPLFADATAAEIAVPIRAADIAVVFAENQEQVDKLLGLGARCPSIRQIVYDDDRGMRHYRQPQLAAYATLLAQGRALVAAQPASIQAELARRLGSEPAALFFTGGTTGPARGVVHTHAALIDRARAVAAIDGVQHGDVTLAYLPPAWIVQHFFSYALPMVAGACVCCPESSETMLLDMREMGPTFFLAPPRVLEALLTQIATRMEGNGRLKRSLYARCMSLAQRVGARRLGGQTVAFGDRVAYALGNLLVYGPLRDVMGMSQVRVAHAVGEGVSPELLLAYRAIGINLKPLYGSTETGVFVSMQADGEVRSDTVGPAAPGVELKIGAQREVLVRSPGLFVGYHGDADGTRQATHGDGWFHTGDAGWLGDDGHLRITGRLQDIGSLLDGTPFSPRLLENKLKFSPYVKEAVAFGDRRATVCALVNIDLEAVGLWADRQGISYTGYADLASHDAVAGLVGEWVAKVNAELVLDPALAPLQIHRFLVLHKMLEADDGELTRMRKLRRAVIAERFAALVEALYDGRRSLRVDAEVRYDDGRVGLLSADVKISDAKTFAAAPLKKAA